MSLQKQRVVSLHAESVIDDTRVVRLSSTITSDEKVNSSYSESILNNEVYKTNREEVRADIAEFRKAIYEVEDEMIALAKAEQPEPEEETEEPVDPDEPQEEN